MRTWTTQQFIDGDPDAVVDVLTDPDACARWSPIPFELETLDGGRRLSSGSRARINGRLAGLCVGFEVEIHAAGRDGLKLAASGPIDLHVTYDVAPAAGGTDVRASIGVREGRGFSGRVLAKATGALLAGGALDHALSRIAREVAGDGDRRLAIAA